MIKLLLALTVAAFQLNAQELQDNLTPAFEKKYLEAIEKDPLNPPLLKMSKSQYDNLPSIECDMQDHNSIGYFKVDVKLKKVVKFRGFIERPYEKRFTVSVKEPISPDDIFIVYRKLNGRIEQGLVYLTN